MRGLTTLAAAMVAGCTPKASEGISQPSDDVPYARVVTLHFERPVTLTGEATDGEHTIPISVGPSEDPRFRLVGLYADRRWRIHLTSTDDRGHQESLDELSFTTDPLPNTFPEVTLLPGTGRPEPGYTLVSLINVDTDGWLAALDADGEVAWLWADGGAKFLEARPSADGVLAMLGEYQLVEMDWDGEVRRTVDASGPTPIFTHELSAQPDGTWLTLSRETRSFDAYPQSYDVPWLVAPAAVAADWIAAIDPDTGEVVDSLHLADRLDQGRIGYDSLNDDPFGEDWTHANAVCADDSGAWVVSLRHQDAVVALDRATGQIRWILGTHDNWGPAFADALLEPVGEPFAWQYHQHAVKCLGDGRYLLFDNGNRETSPWTGVDPLKPSEIRSRVVRFRVDEAARTVTQEWQYQPSPALASPIMGDADLLPGGHVLATFAHVDDIGGLPVSSFGRGAFSFQVHEVDQASGAVVWGVDVWAPAGARFPDWRSYRAERFESFGEGGPPP